MTLSPNWKEDEDEAIEISTTTTTTKEKQQGEEDEIVLDWKAVGTPSRRTSFFLRVLDNNSPPQQPPPEFKRRNSTPTTTEKQWGSFGGFQWEGPCIFEEQEDNTNNSSTMIPPSSSFSLLPPNSSIPATTTTTTTTATTATTATDLFYDDHSSPPPIKSLLPNIPLEPTFRPQRSYSFSIGQHDSSNHFFGGEDNMYTRSALAPTMEEEEDIIHDDAYLRARSQSSNAAFGFSSLYSSSSWNTRLPPPHTAPTARRSSLGFVSSSPFLTNSQEYSPAPPFPPSEQYQRRMSQPSLITPPSIDYSFPPDNIPNDNNSMVVGPPTSSFITSNSSLLLQQYQLSERLENTYINSQATREPPERSLSTPPAPLAQQNEITSTSGGGGGGAGGKGMLLLRLPPHIPLYMVEFKSGRNDFYYVSDPLLSLRIRDLVIVEADRGKDLGKIATDILTVDQVALLQQQQQQHNSLLLDDDHTTSSSSSKKDYHVKRIYRQANTDEINMLIIKDQDEQRALSICLQKIKNRKLPMEVVDAEFQWDRRKLTFYFIAEKRIDFRELVRELFKIYKTRIWMCAVNNLADSAEKSTISSR